MSAGSIADSATSAALSLVKVERDPPARLTAWVVKVLKTGVASGLAWWLGSLLGSRPVFAVLAVIIVMQTGHGLRPSSRT